ncbi:hypothetical protein D3C85_1632620 [compost metagenome]
MLVESDFHIFQHGHGCKQPDVLKSARRPFMVNLVGLHAADRFIVKDDAACRGRINPGQQVKQCCFACTVGSDQTDKLAFADIKGNFAKGFKPAKRTAGLFNLKKHCFR